MAPPRTRRRSLLRRVLGRRGRRLRARRAVLALALVAGAVAGRLFVWPPVDEPSLADAVVVLGDAAPVGLDPAAALVERRAAPVLVIPNGAHPSWPEANRLCALRRPGLTVLCPAAGNDTLRGQARLVGLLAAERGWNDLAVVSDRDRLSRVRLALGRCLTGEHLQAVAAAPGPGVAERLRRAPGNAAAYAALLSAQRDC
ncbi:MAG: hypothetical protein ACKVWR_04815 [Acidimicrobiales bacterium]